MVRIHASFTELSARERAENLLDTGSAREMLGPFSHLKSPHLLKQGIVPQNDDGMIVMKGRFEGRDTVVIAMEGKFQGGGIGEISGAKFAAALQEVLNDNQAGHPVFPVIIMDTGGVRLQEANYGLLAIAEIQDLLVSIREYVPVIGLIPGKVGCFGGMSMTCSLFSYIIMTKEGRLTLNGPEVIEQEAGIGEWDSSDKAFTYRTIGGEHRVAQGLADVLTEDSREAVHQAVKNCMEKGIPVHRSTMVEEYRAKIDKAAPGNAVSKKAVPANAASDNTRSENVAPGSEKNSAGLRGRVWFEALTEDAITGNLGSIGSVLCRDIILGNRTCRVLAVTADPHTIFPRTRKGEVGLQQGWELARLIRQAVEEDNDSPEKRALIAVVDVPSQAYGYLEEYHGIFLSCAASVNAYAMARHAGHPVITVIVGNAISGAFLAHGLQGSHMIALDDETITVHAMSKKSAARITKRSIEDMDKAADSVAAIAYDIHSFNCLGAVNTLLKFPDHDHPSEDDVRVMKEKIAEGIRESEANGNTLDYRLKTPNAPKYRALSIQVRRQMAEAWREK